MALIVSGAKFARSRREAHVNFDALTGNCVWRVVGGVQGRSVNLQTTSPFPAANGQPEKERDWLVTVPMRDGSVIFMMFVAPQSEFARFQPTYEAMLKSMRF